MVKTKAEEHIDMDNNWAPALVVLQSTILDLIGGVC